MYLTKKLGNNPLYDLLFMCQMFFLGGMLFSLSHPDKRYPLVAIGLYVSTAFVTFLHERTMKASR